MYIATLTSILAFFIIFSAGFFDIVFALKDSHGALERIIASKASQLAGRLPESGDKPVQKKAEPFSLESVCGTIMDTGSGAFLFSKEARKKWPIASITKLATALVFLNHNPGWEEVYTIKDEDRREGGRINVFKGDRVKVNDLFNLSLVGSDNTATIALVRSTGMSEKEFVQKMNETAEALGLDNTRFFDAVGLSNDNVSTAREVAKLAQSALAKAEIREATLKKKHEFFTLGGKKIIIYNTDDLLHNFPQNGLKIQGGKTGYTESAGYCFVGKFIDQAGREIISVVLGSPDNDSRFSQTKNLVEWAYKNFIW